MRVIGVIKSQLMFQLLAEGWIQEITRGVERGQILLIAVMETGIQLADWRMQVLG
jgi:hypothetical protein